MSRKSKQLQKLEAIIFTLPIFAGYYLFFPPLHCKSGEEGKVNTTFTANQIKYLCMFFLFLGGVLFNKSSLSTRSVCLLNYKQKKSAPEGLGQKQWVSRLPHCLTLISALFKAAAVCDTVTH